MNVAEAFEQLERCNDLKALETTWLENVVMWSSGFWDQEAQRLISLKNCLKQILANVNRIHPEVVMVQNKEDLLNMNKYLDLIRPKHIFMDVETTGLDPFDDSLSLIQLLAGGRVFLIHIDKIGTGSDKDSLFSGLLNILEDQTITKIFHNAKFDLKFLKCKLFRHYPIHIQGLFDTYIAEQLLTAGLPTNNGDHTLKALAKKYLDIELDKSSQETFKGGDLTEGQIRYAMYDVKVLDGIFKEQSRMLAEASLVNVAMLEFGIIPAVASVELAGMKVDLQKLENIKIRCVEELKNLEKELNIIVAEIDSEKQTPLIEPNVNFRSPLQIKGILSKLGYPVETTSVETLSKIDHSFAKRLVEHRKVSKLLSSFVEKLPKHVHSRTGRIHPQFFQLGTEAGRFTCEKPNLQQIPKVQEWRDLFIASEGYCIVTADYSQIELRILAEYSQDPAFLEAYRKGQDLHLWTASEIFGVPVDQITKDQRNTAKTINFGLCYGMGPVGLAGRLNIRVEEAERFITAYFRAFPEVKNTLQRLGMEAVLNLFTETLLGRRRYFKPPESFGTQKSLERKGRNTPIQGTSADITKKAILYLMIDLKRYDARIINLVHDELVLEVREDQIEEVKHIVEKDMIRAGEDLIKSVPIEVEITIDMVWRK